MRNWIIYVAAIPALCLTSSMVSGQSAVKVARSTDKAKSLVGNVAGGVVAESQPSPIWSPMVVMSEQHRATCNKLVGDKIAGTEVVTDMSGENHQLSDLLSDKLTVLIFWEAGSRPAREQFRRIPVDILGDFAKHRVRVIAAHVGGEMEATRKITGDAADKIVSLVDKESKLFHQFAKSRIPRTYLLDNSGKILWFDLEYSRSTQRELSNALNFHLKK